MHVNEDPYTKAVRELNDAYDRQTIKIWLSLFTFLAVEIAILQYYLG